MLYENFSLQDLPKQIKQKIQSNKTKPPYWQACKHTADIYKSEGVRKWYCTQTVHHSNSTAMVRDVSSQQKPHDRLAVDMLICRQTSTVCVWEVFHCTSMIEEKWLIKDLLLLQCHVAPVQSQSVREIYQADSSLPGVLGSCTRESQPHVKLSITHRPLLAGGINPSHWSMQDVVALL